jgi:hypothetical protein
METPILVAEKGGPMALPRIGVLLALNRHLERGGHRPQPTIARFEVSALGVADGQRYLKSSVAIRRLFPERTR